MSPVFQENTIKENNKRLAKNTVLLYVRMFLSMLISLYTSRVILQVLGVEDYGIYSVTGGFVMAFSFINNAMAGSTSRFITYEIGQGNKQRTNDTFIMAFFEHLIIALLVLLISETVGLWFLNNKLVIPANRMNAANWVYQMSVLSMMITITQTPYMACVIAHERMDVYAYVELLNVFLKLGIVYVLLIGNYDKLILYSSLVFSVSLLIAIIYRIFCTIRFEECHLHLIWKRDILRPMLAYSGWDLYGHLSDMARNQGVVLVQNHFFGPIVNAASGIASTVQSVVMKFASSVMTSVKPQIVKYYSQGAFEDMVRLVHYSIRINAVILMLVTVPLLMELDFVLHLWLGEVPNYTVSFCSFMLIFNLVGNISSVLTIGIQATGNLRRQTLINATLYIAVVPFSFIAFKYGNEPWLSYLFNVCAIFLGMLNCVFTFAHLVKEFKVSSFFLKDFIPLLSIFSVAMLGCLACHHCFEVGWLRLFATIGISSVLILAVSYFTILPPSVKMIVDKYLGFRKKTLL